MADITFTCANCGGTELVEDKPESTRNLLCKKCGGAASRSTFTRGHDHGRLKIWTVADHQAWEVLL